MTEQQRVKDSETKMFGTKPKEQWSKTACAPV